MKILQKIRNIILLIMIPLGITMVRLPKKFAYTNDIFTIHKSIGVLFAIILLAIIVCSIADIIQKKTKDVPLNIKIIRSILLFLSLAIVISGFLLIFYKGKNVPFFWLFSIPSPFSKNIALHKNFEMLHEYFAYAMAFAIVALQTKKFIINKKST